MKLIYGNLLHFYTIITKDHKNKFKKFTMENSMKVTLKIKNRVTIKVKLSQSCLTICNPMDLYSPWNSPGQNTGVGSRSLLQGICLIQELNWGLLHCRQILYQLSYQGSPELSYGPEILHLRIYPEKNMIQKYYIHPNIHFNTVHNRQDMEAT